MSRLGWKMKLRPGSMAEYKRLHDDIWPEMIALMRDHTIHDYTVFIDPKEDWVFAIQHRRDDAKADSIADSEIQRKWLHHNRNVLETDDKGALIIVPLVEVFHMD